MEGSAVVEFYIETDGSVKDIKVVRGLCKSIAEESERVIRGMPKWYKPGQENGVSVKTRFVLPLKFRLE